jgi:Xaa-Pro aminopeptidase
VNSVNARQHEELARARAALTAAGSDFALLSSLPNVTYASGWEVPVPIGALSELAYGVPLLLLSTRESAAWLIVPNVSAADAQEQARVAQILQVDTFDSFNPTDSRASFLGELRDAFRQAGMIGSGGVLAIEGRSLPQAAAALIGEALPDWTMVDAEGPLQQARLVKTEREISLLRRAAVLADISHDTLRELCRDAGRTEYGMWAEIAARVYQAAGHDIPLSGELVTGPRSSTVAYPNGPRERSTKPGDAALMDLSGRMDGYWFDCTNTHVVGGVEPTDEQRRYARASQAACEAAMEALRPGVLAADAAAAAQAAFARFGLPMAHYAGHQIGVTVNELPRLVPYDRTVIEAGMVFSVEPGAYQESGGTFGARSEKMVLVTSSGPEILSNFAWGI